MRRRPTRRTHPKDALTSRRIDGKWWRVLHSVSRPLPSLPLHCGRGGRIDVVNLAQARQIGAGAAITSWAWLAPRGRSPFGERPSREVGRRLRPPSSEDPSLEGVLVRRNVVAEVDRRRLASNKPAKRTSKKVAGASERWPSVGSNPARLKRPFGLLSHAKKRRESGRGAKTLRDRPRPSVV
jgi:hypothetical protein